MGRIDVLPGVAQPLSFESGVVTAISSLESVQKVFGWRQKKSANLNDSLRAVLDETTTVYNLLEHAVLTSKIEALPLGQSSFQVGQILFNIYSQLKGSCFEQYSSLLDLLIRIMKNYVALLRQNAALATDLNLVKADHNVLDAAVHSLVIAVRKYVALAVRDENDIIKRGDPVAVVIEGLSNLSMNCPADELSMLAVKIANSSGSS